MVAAAGEKIGDLIMGRQKPLHLPRRVEPLQDPFSSSGRLVGSLRPVVEALVLPMLDAGHDLTLGRSVATELVSDQNARRSPLLLQDLAEQAFGGLLVAPALYEDIKNKALLVDRVPEPVLLAGDAEDNLVKMPFVAAAGGLLTKAADKFPAEFRLRCRIASQVTEMPQAASISPTMRRLNGNWKYSQTA